MKLYEEINDIKYYNEHIFAFMDLKKEQLLYWNRELRKWYISTPEQERVRKESQERTKVSGLEK